MKLNVSKCICTLGPKKNSTIKTNSVTALTDQPDTPNVPHQYDVYLTFIQCIVQANRHMQSITKPYYDPEGVSTTRPLHSLRSTKQISTTNCPPRHHECSHICHCDIYPTLDPPQNFTPQVVLQVLNHSHIHIRLLSPLFGAATWSIVFATHCQSQYLPCTWMIHQCSENYHHGSCANRWWFDPCSIGNDWLIPQRNARYGHEYVSILRSNTVSMNYNLTNNIISNCSMYSDSSKHIRQVCDFQHVTLPGK